MRKTELIYWLRGVQSALDASDTDVKSKMINRILDEVIKQLVFVEPNKSFPSWLKEQYQMQDISEISISEMYDYYREWLAE